MPDNPDRIIRISKTPWGIQVIWGSKLLIMLSDFSGSSPAGDLCWMSFPISSLSFPVISSFYCVDKGKNVPKCFILQSYRATEDIIQLF